MRSSLLILLGLLFYATISRADETGWTGVRPTIRAHRIAAAPVFDGLVADDPVWQGVAPGQDFVQAAPDEGAHASEATEVRIAYTDDTLFVGVVCHDRTPAAIVTTDTRRDSPLENTDAFLMIFDTFRDGQNGLVFGTNPAGVEHDGQVVNEGQANTLFMFQNQRQQAGSGAGYNLNWDGVWNVKTRIDEQGWSAEFAIPFRTLRYPGAGAQQWRVNFQRNIRRRVERAFWAPLPRQFNLYRVSAAGTLEGLEIAAQRNLKVIPYVLRELHHDFGPDGGMHWRSAGGVDLKYSLTPGITFDGTVGTDFSQVEVDEQQLDLTRFNLLFPEKRPFFLENAGVFSVGEPGEVDLFFSRRIGLGPNGETIPLAGGARVSGKAGPVRIGLLDMQTEAVTGIAPANNFGAARLAYELPNRSYVGALFTNRQATSGADPSHDHNSTIAVDGRWGIGRYGLVSGYAAKTETPGRDGKDLAWHLGALYDSPTWLVDAKIEQLQKNFNPEVGFLVRDNYTKPDLFVMYRYRPREFLGIYEVRPHMRSQIYYKPDGDVETSYVHLDNAVEWRNGYEISTALNFRNERVFDPFEINPGVVVPMGYYQHKEFHGRFSTDRGARVSAAATVTAGGWYGGKALQAMPELYLRFGESASVDVAWSRILADLPVGQFTTDLARARLSYSFTSRLYAQALVQYNRQVHTWANNVRLGWLQSGGAGLFLVYNENVDTASGWGYFYTLERSIALKLSLMVDVL